MIIVRVLVGIVLFGLSAEALGFAIGLAGSAKWQLICLLIAPPLTLGALAVFAPLEQRLDACRLHRFKNLIVPAFGALICLLAGALHWSLSGPLALDLGRRLATPPISLIVWIGFGSVWGGVWRLSDLLSMSLAARTRRRPNASTTRRGNAP